MDWFDSEIISRDLARRSFRGFSLTLGGQLLKFVINVGATAVLARLLLPDDFGLVGMIVSVTGVAHVLKDLGLSTAVMQRPHLSHREASCLFWIMLLVGIGIAVVLAFTGPLIAWILSEPRLTRIAPVIALSFLFAAMGTLHQALLRRHMQFGTIATIELFSGLLSYLLAIALAFGGLGYWALVLQQVSLFVFIALGSWMACSWRPSSLLWEPSVKHMIGFGGNVTASNLLSYLCRNLDNVLIGRFSGATSLGLYSKAYQLLLLPISQINTPMLNVMTPALSRVQLDPARFKALYLKAITAIVVIGMPLVVFMFVRADQIIFVALGRDWMGAVLLFRLLAPAAFIDTFNIAAGLIFNTLGQTARQLRLSTVSAFAIVLGICVGIRWGAAGVAVAVSVVTLIIRIPAYRYVYAESPLSISDLLSVLWRPATCSLAAGTILFFINPFGGSTLSVAASILRDGIIFALCFVLFWIALPGGVRIMRDTITLLKSLLTTRDQPAKPRGSYAGAQG